MRHRVFTLTPGQPQSKLKLVLLRHLMILLTLLQCQLQLLLLSHQGRELITAVVTRVDVDRDWLPQLLL